MPDLDPSDEARKTVYGIPCTTVGELRRLLKGCSDGDLIMPQVRARDGTAWEMEIGVQTIYSLDSEQRQLPGVFICMSHPDLESLLDDDSPLSSLKLRMY